MAIWMEKAYLNSKTGLFMMESISITRNMAQAYILKMVKLTKENGNTESEKEKGSSQMSEEGVQKDTGRMGKDTIPEGMIAIVMII